MTFKKNQKGVTSTVPTNPTPATTPDPVEPGTKPAGDNLKKNQYGLPTSDALELDEGGCGSHKREDGVCPSCGKMHEEVDLEENEELEEGPMPMIDEPKDEDLNGDGEKGSGEVPAFLKKKQEESKIQTPEQENALYEQRFAPKNNRLFEKLVKQWTK